MDLSKKAMKDQHDEIIEAVHQGIVSSKQSESRFMGEFKDTLKKVVEYQQTQNGRTEKHSKVLEEHTAKLAELTKTIEVSTAKVKSSLWAFSITSGIIILLVSVIYGNIITNVNKTTENVDKLTAILLNKNN